MVAALESNVRFPGGEDTEMQPPAASGARGAARSG